MADSETGQTERCASCGALNPAGYSTCSLCGAPRPAVPQQPTEPAPRNREERLPEQPPVRLWQLVWAVIVKPVDALENGLPRYLDNPGARLTIVGFYAAVTLLGLAALGALAARESASVVSGGVGNVAALAFGQVLAALVSLAASAVALSGLNTLTGRGYNFWTDTLDLCVGLSLVYGTVGVVAYPLGMVLGLTPFVSLVLLLVFAQGFWRLGLGVVLVSVAYDYEWPLALVVLLVANAMASGLLVA